MSTESAGNSPAMNLLRLLEPAVRPGGLHGPNKAPSEPIEQRSFESLLDEARGIDLDGPVDVPTGDETSEAPAVRKPAGLIGQLAQFDRIDNPSLRRLLAGDAANEL